MAYPPHGPNFFAEQGSYNHPELTAIEGDIYYPWSSTTGLSPSTLSSDSSLAGALGADDAPALQAVTPPHTTACPLHELNLFTEQDLHDFPELAAMDGGACCPWPSTTTAVSPCNISSYSTLAGVFGADDAQAQVATPATPQPFEPASQATSPEAGAENDTPVATAGPGQGGPGVRRRSTKMRKYYEAGRPLWHYLDMAEFIKECFVEDGKLSPEGAKFIEQNWVRDCKAEGLDVSEVQNSRTMEMLSRHSQYVCYICSVSLLAAGRHSNTNKHRAEIAQFLGIPMSGVSLVD